MDTNAAATNPLGDDVEQGRGATQRNAAYKTSYVRDITYKVIPFCIIFLVVFSVSAVLVSTLAYGKPVPQQGTIVISSMLGAFFILFCLGGIYLYHEKHYPPLTKGPNCPDRPEPASKNAHLRRHATWKTMSRTFQRGGKSIMTTFTQRATSYTGTGSTVSRLRHHEEEMPDRLQGRAVSPDTFRAQTLHSNDPSPALENNHNSQERRQSPAQPPYSSQRHRGPTRAGKNTQPGSAARNIVPRAKRRQGDVSSPPAVPPVLRTPHERRAQAQTITRRPVPNARPIHQLGPQHPSHLRHAHTAARDPGHPRNSPRHVAVDLDPMLRSPTGNIRRRQYPDLPPGASGNTMSPHPGTSVHDGAADSPAPSRTFEEILPEGGSGRSPRSFTSRVADAVRQIYAGVVVVVVPDTDRQPVFAQPGVYLKLPDPDHLGPGGGDVLVPECAGECGGSLQGPGLRPPAPAYLGTPGSRPRSCDPPAPDRPQGARSPPAAISSSPDPFIDAEIRAWSSLRRPANDVAPSCPSNENDNQTHARRDSAIPMPLAIHKTPSRARADCPDHHPHNHHHHRALSPNLAPTTSPPSPRAASPDALGILLPGRHHHRHHQDDLSRRGADPHAPYRGGRAARGEREGGGGGGREGQGSITPASARTPPAVPSRGSSKGKCGGTGGAQ